LVVNVVHFVVLLLLSFVVMSVDFAVSVELVQNVVNIKHFLVLPYTVWSQILGKSV